MKYSNLLFLISLLFCVDSCKKDLTINNENIVKDVSGNKYNLIKIGNQTWIAENFRSTKYNNGDEIPIISNCAEWSTLVTGACCYYNNESSNGIVFGVLYNYYALSDPRGLAPTGFHVATDEDWRILIESLGGLEVAGGKLKEIGFTYWDQPNTGATNENGFNCRAGGYRDRNCVFQGLGKFCAYWTATEIEPGKAINRIIYNNSTSITREWSNPGQNGSGDYIRIVKD